MPAEAAPVAVAMSTKLEWFTSRNDQSPYLMNAHKICDLFLCYYCLGPALNPIAKIQFFKSWDVCKSYTHLYFRWHSKVYDFSMRLVWSTFITYLAWNLDISSPIRTWYCCIFSFFYFIWMIFIVKRQRSLDDYINPSYFLFIFRSVAIFAFFPYIWLTWTIYITYNAYMWMWGEVTKRTKVA